MGVGSAVPVSPDGPRFSRPTSKMTTRMARLSLRHAEPCPVPCRSAPSVVNAFPLEPAGDHVGDCDDRAARDPDACPIRKPEPRDQNQTSEPKLDENVITAKRQEPVRVAANSAVDPGLDNQGSTPDEPKARAVRFTDRRVLRGDNCIFPVGPPLSPKIGEQKGCRFSIHHLLRYYPRESAFISGQKLSAVFVFSRQSKS